ncbi:Hypothetical protein FKW44_023774 [Caligus rogercresseyi]|uniref:Uncharacterized protein n=1 Tax=Caligus rogercresseyi TaxID=217165 RepID=A0A7T8GPV0_CALRO|nr:Hypothetical protein FKW44_023774 [Caligus rogercresseyi]
MDAMSAMFNLLRVLLPNNMVCGRSSQKKASNDLLGASTNDMAKRYKKNMGDHS